MRYRPKITVIGLCGKSVFMTVDHFHQEGETVHADTIYVEPGGKGYNQAVAAARLGADVTFISCCGMDDGADLCEQFLVKEGVKPMIHRIPDEATPFATILTDREGRNRVTVYSGAAQKMTEDMIAQDKAVIEDSDVILLNFEYPNEINYAALRIAEESGVCAILNPAPAKKVSSDFLQRFHVTTPNQTEVLAYPGMNGEQTPSEIANALYKNGYTNTVVTLGGDGVLTVEDTMIRHYDAIKCDAVDTTGAGDTFNGALAVAVAEGKTLKDAVVFAQNAASLSVRKHCVMPSIPTRAEVCSSFVEINPRRLSRVGDISV